MANWGVYCRSQLANFKTLTNSQPKGGFMAGFNFVNYSLKVDLIIGGRYILSKGQTQEY